MRGADQMGNQQVKRGYLGSRYPNGRVYVGIIENGAVTEPLPHIERHSPGGFEWGYAGSGPADLALSILTHALGQTQPDTIPPALYQQFKDDIVTRLPRDRNWEFSREYVLRWVDKHGDLASGMFE
jgi:hypothetical protein